MNETIKSLARVQRKVYAAFLNGAKLTAADISIITHCSDPRTHIRNLRNKGIQILDEWRNGDDGVRYKVYWLKNANG